MPERFCCAFLFLNRKTFASKESNRSIAINFTFDRVHNWLPTNCEPHTTIQVIGLLLGFSQLIVNSVLLFVYRIDILSLLSNLTPCCLTFIQATNKYEKFASHRSSLVLWPSSHLFYPHWPSSHLQLQSWKQTRLKLIVGSLISISLISAFRICNRKYDVVSAMVLTLPAVQHIIYSLDSSFIAGDKFDTLQKVSTSPRS